MLWLPEAQGAPASSRCPEGGAALSPHPQLQNEQSPTPIDTLMMMMMRRRRRRRRRRSSTKVWRGPWSVTNVDDESTNKCRRKHERHQRHQNKSNAGTRVLTRRRWALALPSLPSCCPGGRRRALGLCPWWRRRRRFCPWWCRWPWLLPRARRRRRTLRLGGTRRRRRAATCSRWCRWCCLSPRRSRRLRLGTWRRRRSSAGLLSRRRRRATGLLARRRC